MERRQPALLADEVVVAEGRVARRGGAALLFLFVRGPLIECVRVRRLFVFRLVLVGRILALGLPRLRFFSLLFFPILIVFSSLARLLSRVVGDDPERKNPFTLREEIMTMMQMTAVEGDIEPLTLPVAPARRSSLRPCRRIHTG